jgi:hypothetical protein
MHGATIKGNNTEFKANLTPMKELIGTGASVTTMLPNVANKILNATENNDGHVVYYTGRAAFMTPGIQYVFVTTEEHRIVVIYFLTCWQYNAQLTAFQIVHSNTEEPFYRN